jgi:hypothetical protein
MLRWHLWRQYLQLVSNAQGQSDTRSLWMWLYIFTSVAACLTTLECLVWCSGRSSVGLLTPAHEGRYASSYLALTDINSSTLLTSTWSMIASSLPLSIHSFVLVIQTTLFSAEVWSHGILWVELGLHCWARSLPPGRICLQGMSAAPKGGSPFLRRWSASCWTQQYYVGDRGVYVTWHPPVGALRHTHQSTYNRITENPFLYTNFLLLLLSLLLFQGSTNTPSRQLK